MVSIKKIESNLNKSKSSVAEPEIPLLPNPRSRLLTPSPSTEDIATQAQIAPVFTLPPELRRKILDEAFDDRTIHIDLVLKYPLRLQRSDRRYPEHRFTTNYGHCWPETSGNLCLDRSQPKHWQWRGCVCHRLPPPQYCRDETVPGWEQPADDFCCEGESHHCELWVKTLKDPKCCFKGVMGWLLSCRQAYVEGVEVLYGTNTVHLGSKALLDNLSALLLPQRLSIIPGLEDVWSVGTHEHQGRAAPNQHQLEKILHVLDTQFPSLSILHLGIRLDLPIVQMVNSRPTMQRAYLDGMLRILDEFVKRRKGCLRKPFILSITTSAWRDLERCIRTGGYPGMWLSCSRIWRCLLPGSKVTSGSDENQNATADKGYWTWRDHDAIRRSANSMGRGHLLPHTL
ncbi:hypothetical protein QL093DRAFT_2640864 [Fusarium oxysporum]|nr:hypothetical protein QL093DRAFT_2640864 [Fusarium oxysporum]